MIDRVRDSTNEVGGRVIELGGAEYMVRGLGYLSRCHDLETVPVANKNGTPVLVRDLGRCFGPDIRAVSPNGTARERRSAASS